MSSLYGTPQLKIAHDVTDRIGIRTLILSLLWQPSRGGMTPAEMDEEEPGVPEVAGGLWLIGRQRQPLPGAFRTLWTFEGINGNGKDVTFKGRDNSPDYAFHPGFSQVSLVRHPKWPTFRDSYGAYQQDGQIIIPDAMPTSQQSGPVKQDGKQTPTANPLAGETDFFRMEGTYVFRYASFGVPSEDGVGFIAGSLPGIPPRLDPSELRNWLMAPTQWQRRGPVVEITENYWLSGVGGWPQPIYTPR